MSHALKAGAGRQIAVGPNVITVKADSRQTDGAFTLLDYAVPAGFPGPGLHTHPSFDETFYVLSGELQVVIGDRTETLGPGDFAYVGGSDPHTFANSSDRVANVMLMCTPGGFERYFEQLAELDGMPDAETRARLSAEFGVIPTG